MPQLALLVVRLKSAAERLERASSVRGVERLSLVDALARAVEAIPEARTLRRDRGQFVEMWTNSTEYRKLRTAALHRIAQDEGIADQWPSQCQSLLDSPVPLLMEGELERVRDALALICSPVNPRDEPCLAWLEHVETLLVEAQEIAADGCRWLTYFVEQRDAIAALTEPSSGDESDETPSFPAGAALVMGASTSAATSAMIDAALKIVDVVGSSGPRASARAGRQPPKPQGRRPDTDPDEDERIAKAWATGRFLKYDDLAKDLGKSANAVRKAVDRHRHRRKKYRQK